MTDWLNMVGEQLLFFFILPIIIVYLVGSLSSYLTDQLNQRLGHNLTAILSFFGVVIHELSHLTVALIFRHHIVSFCLWQISEDGILGYVNREYNPKSYYQRLGNFFISLAPILGICLTIWFLLSFGWITGWHIRNIIIVFILVSLLFGFHLSQADWQNFWRGTPFYLTLIVIITTIKFIFFQ